MKTYLETVLMTLLLAAMALAGDWKVADDGETWPFGAGTGDGRTHTFRNNGPDETILVITYTQGGFIFSVTELSPGNDANVFIPKNGSCKVKDESDADSEGASGTYT